MDKSSLEDRKIQYQALQTDDSLAKLLKAKRNYKRSLKDLVKCDLNLSKCIFIMENFNKLVTEKGNK